MPEPNASAQEQCELPHSLVRAELERILASDVFSRSQQLRRFLSFIVEQRLAGHGHSIKESVLAHELYGKGTDFDGGTDPVVRVDARRLRDKLREYYEGRSEPIVISLRKGSYVPVFEEPQKPAPLSDVKRVRTAVVVGVLAAVAGVVATVLIWRALRTPTTAAAGTAQTSLRSMAAGASCSVLRSTDRSGFISVAIGFMNAVTRTS